MTTRYLALVLVEVPSHVEKTKYAGWFYAVSIEQASLRNGLLEVVFSNGDIKVFNQDETDDILTDCGEIINRALWQENPIPGSSIKPLINED
ncbi:hypothetical protein [Crocosphaera sp.]|uniref:hypothetical protein n=1 Tax=Crocosphaera sp. TaxID=2729996 RepID=UPI003F206F13|nr:hypothetical protein [Crocosphaera sp.]